MLLFAPPEGMPLAAWRTAAVAALMAAWWITEALPIAATALAPIVLFPLLRVGTIGEATAPFANPVIYLFLGGFLIAMALEACGLHRRLALAILSVVGTRPANLIFGFMLATAAISMWVSNSATVVMMLPMATSVIALARVAGVTGAAEDVLADGSTPGTAFDVALLLGIAYAGNIGGIGTLIGSPPNALLAGFMADSYGVRIGFLEWMFIGVPIVLLGLPFAWFLLTRWLHPVGNEHVAGGATMIREERARLGSISRAEWTVGVITALTATAWVIRPLLERRLPAISDAGIAIAGALLMFAVPLGWRPLRMALTWKQAERLPWAVLILFGGGLSLAAAIQRTGLAEWIGLALGVLSGWPIFVVILVVTLVMIFLTELTSNTASAAAFLPVVAALGIGIGVDPLQLALPTALAASCAFMLPVATPPNAIVYGTGKLTIPQMATAGLWLNLFFAALIPVVVFLLAARVFAA